MSGWQPIETAPKDGTCVLVVDEDGIVSTGWQSRPAKWRDRNDCTIWRPTHWQPLPDPPEAKS